MRNRTRCAKTLWKDSKNPLYALIGFLFPWPPRISPNPTEIVASTIKSRRGDFARNVRNHNAILHRLEQ